MATRCGARDVALAGRVWNGTIQTAEQEARPERVQKTHNLTRLHRNGIDFVACLLASLRSAKRAETPARLFQSKKAGGAVQAGAGGSVSGDSWHLHNTTCSSSNLTDHGDST